MIIFFIQYTLFNLFFFTKKSIGTKGGKKLKFKNHKIIN